MVIQKLEELGQDLWLNIYDYIQRISEEYTQEYMKLSTCVSSGQTRKIRMYWLDSLSHFHFLKVTWIMIKGIWQAMHMWCYFHSFALSGAALFWSKEGGRGMEVLRYQINTVPKEQTKEDTQRCIFELNKDTTLT